MPLNVGADYSRLLSNDIPLVYSATLKEAMSHHALREQKEANHQDQQQQELANF